MNLLIVLLIGLLNFSLTNTQRIHDLETYLKDDSDIDYFKYQLLQTQSNAKYTTYFLNLTSLKWFDESFSTASVWFHNMNIYVPVNLNPSFPIFFRTEFEPNMGKSTEDYVAQMSYDCACVTVIIKSIPNEPIKFTSDPLGLYKTEDEIVAWTIHLYINSNRTNYIDSSMILLFPMVKAAKRGMDAVDQFLRSQNIPSSNKFVISGRSKRGWTSILATAFEPRVVGSAVIVFDLVNWIPNFRHQYMSMGGAYSFALIDYFRVNLTLLFNDQTFYDIMLQIDPYEYLHNYKDKFILFLLAADDEFMLSENTRFFWRQLALQTKDQIYLRRFINTGHYLTGLDDPLFLQITNFLHIVNTNKHTNPNVKLPLLHWSFPNNITHGVTKLKLSNLEMFSDYRIDLVYATSASKQRRDFRFSAIDSNFNIVYQNIVWNTVKLTDQITISPGQAYEFTHGFCRSMFKNRYTAFFLQATLTVKDTNSPMVFNTETNVIPEYTPAGDCYGYDCYGRLV